MKPKLLNLSMLYVEDDERTRAVLSEVFKNTVKNLYVAKDGLEALKLFQEKHIQLIISDLKMPNMNGNELCSEVKKINPSVHFILLTAYNDNNLLIEAIDSGVDKFLQKPLGKKKLFLLLDEIYKKITNKFQLEKSTFYLKEVEKIAHLSYWDINIDAKDMVFSPEVLELFSLQNQKNSLIDYKTLSNVVEDTDKSRFLDIFEKRVYEEDINEVVVLKDTNNTKTYINIIAKRWESSIYGNEHVIGIFQDVSGCEVQKLTLLKECQSDPMLKISNKKQVLLELENLIGSSERYGHSIGVAFIDIDNFKTINDNYGHLVADNILVELSTLIECNIRNSDMFGRWGGDEFVLITTHSTPDATIILGEKILSKIKRHMWSEGINLTISMGIAFYEVGDNVKELLNRADLKMLEAKKSGKNRCYH